MTASTRPSLLFFLRLSKSAMPSSPDRKSPSPSSASAPPLMEHDASGSNFYTQRRLTRSRKLRHVSDDELGFHPSETERSISTSVSPDSPLKSRSDHCSAVPHPLPLPELWLRRNTANSGSPVAAEMSCSAIARKDSDQGITTSAKSPRKGYRRVFGYSNSEAANYNLRLKVPVRSAPSTPSISPRASETIDLFPSQPHPVKRAYSHDVDAKGIHYNCELNASTSKHGFSTPVSPQRTDAGDLFIPSFEGFPVWNTRNRVPPRNSKSLNASPLHHSLLRKSDMEWLHAQPLPLPPGALVPPPSPVSPQSTIAHHTMEKTEASSPMKNQWKKGKLIGRGTFGSVYVGSNRETGALCAMKEVDLAPDEPKAAECIRQLEQEIKVLGQLKHPNIVQYYGSEIVDDHFYIYLEHVYPGSINKYVQEHVGDMTESVVRNFTRHILSGLTYLHSTKTVHRDIKGANLLVDATGVVKLADFGMAKLLTGETSLLSLKGSPHWMAPEVMQGTVPKNANPDIAFAIDIWSLGCTIIEMVTGKPPWSEFEGPAAMFKVLHRSPPIPETLSSEGKNFLQLCFRRNPAERPSASKLLEHPFVQSLHVQNTSTTMQTLCGLNLMDRPLNPRGTWKMNGSSQREGRTYYSQEWYAETSGHATATRQTLLSFPAQLNRLLLDLSPSSQTSSHMHFGAVNNHPCAPSRARGREVSHL